MKAICGGRLVMHDRIEEGKAILFEDKIIGIVPESEVPAEAERIEVNGALVTPGLFDVHIHGSGGFFYLFYFRDANDRKGAFGKGPGDGGLGRGDVMRFPDFLQGCKDAVQFVHDAVVALSSSASFWHEVVFVILAGEGALFEDHVSVEGDALFFAIVQDACTFGRPVEKAVMVLHGCDVKAFCRKDFLCSFDFF